MKVLVVEDNVDLSANIADFLNDRGHVVDLAHDGATGLRQALEHEYSVIVLNLVLPKIDGLEVCRRLRNEAIRSPPVLMLTASARLEDKLRAFRFGTDDYLVKPFALPELEARLLALTKRAKPEKAENLLRVADLTFNLKTQEVKRAGRPIKLTPMDLHVLRFLMLQSRRVVFKSELAKLLWGSDPPDSDALRVHIHRLRIAIDRPFDRALIQTVHGIGYRLADPDANEH